MKNVDNEWVVINKKCLTDLFRQHKISCSWCKKEIKIDEKAYFDGSADMYCTKKCRQKAHNLLKMRWNENKALEGMLDNAHFECIRFEHLGDFHK